MFKLWAIESVTPHHDWRRVSRVRGAEAVEPVPTDDDPAPRRRSPAAGGPWGRALRAAAEAPPAPVQRVSALMSAPALHVQATDPLDVAQDLLLDGGVRHLPVLGDDGRLVGVLSDRDLLRHPAAPTCADAMHSPALAAAPDATLHAAAQVMLEARVGCLPVVDDDGALLGILTRSDLLRAFAAGALAARA